jgi:hypothetical protein
MFGINSPVIHLSSIAYDASQLFTPAVHVGAQGHLISYE